MKKSNSRSKSARKGKKAWRKISSEAFDDFNEKATKDALSGGNLRSLPSDSLFFLDKSTDVDVKRKVERTREKVLRYESVLQKNPFVQVIPSSTLKKKKKKSDKQANKADMDVDASVVESTKASGDGGKQESGLVDVWSVEGYDSIKGKKQVKTAIPAVEVEPAGCSFNPEPESHKDMLARAVADEMRKVYQSELGPQPIPLIAAREVIDEEERYFMDADSGSEDDADDKTPSGDDDTTAENRSSKTKRVTRVVSNRRARRKEQQKAESEAKKKENLSKEIDCISDIMQEIVEEEEESKKRNLRRIVGKQERLKSCPPRLGKRKFEPAPVQVLLSEEISGSLRKLKGCCTLARDRFKSLEKRGLVVPTKKSRSYKFSFNSFHLINQESMCIFTLPLQLECLANYNAELSLLEYHMLRYSPSITAASVVFLYSWSTISSKVCLFKGFVCTTYIDFETGEGMLERAKQL